MDLVRTDRLVEILLDRTSLGYQVSRRSGILNVTKCVFYRKRLIYLFDIAEDFVFTRANGYSAVKFRKEYDNSWWIIEMAIN